jgi:hypothetical protein
MSIERVLNKYEELMKSDLFLGYEKEFADRMISALSKGYQQGLHEPPLVKVVEDVVNSVNGFVARNPKTQVRLSTKSIFVHGSKSQVEFDFYGQNAQRELCDLIFLVSIVLNGQKYFEKMTLNQFKKDKIEHSTTLWSLDNREQLYLLSRFPSFTGIKGSLVPLKKHSLANYSGCLGSYGFLYAPGDFAFVSATRLSLFLGDKKTLRIEELYGLADNKVSYVLGWAPLPIHPLWYTLFGNCHFCHHVFSFVDEYLKMNIGEPVFMKVGLDNPQSRNFLYELMDAIENKAKKEGDRRTLDFINEFNRFPYEDKNRSDKDPDFDFEGGEIGIIHTIIDLGEWNFKLN